MTINILLDGEDIKFESDKTDHNSAKAEIYKFYKHLATKPILAAFDERLAYLIIRVPVNSFKSTDDIKALFFSGQKQLVPFKFISEKDIIDTAIRNAKNVAPAFKK